MLFNTDKQRYRIETYTDGKWIEVGEASLHPGAWDSEVFAALEAIRIYAPRENDWVDFVNNGMFVYDGNGKLIVRGFPV